MPWVTIPVFYWLHPDPYPPITGASEPDLAATYRQNITLLISAAWRFADDTDQVTSSVRALRRDEYHSHRRELFLVHDLLGNLFQARAYCGPQFTGLYLQPVSLLTATLPDWLHRKSRYKRNDSKKPRPERGFCCTK